MSTIALLRVPLIAPACACVCYPAMAGALGVSTSKRLYAYAAPASVIFALLCCGLILRAHFRGRMPRPEARIWLIPLAFMLTMLVGPALAAEIGATPPTVVSAEWGPYLEVLLRWVAEASIPGAAVVIVGLLWRTSTLARMFISEELVERTIRKWADFAINETAHATKGKTLDVNVGSEVIANALRRGQERASASKVSEWAWKAGGGPREVGKKIFRMLDIEEGADAKVAVEKALRKVGH